MIEEKYEDKPAEGKKVVKMCESDMYKNPHLILLNPRFKVKYFNNLIS